MVLWPTKPNKSCNPWFYLMRWINLVTSNSYAMRWISYPTMQLMLKSNKDTKIGVFKRTLTNVVLGPATYNATIKSPKGVKIIVKSSSLIFSHTMEKNFILVVKAKSMTSTKIHSGSLIWRSSVYYVRGSIVIYSS
ncbi:hypothetical protein PIB30_064704 [Stylosanthes scabra]|uniref:Subtilisin-like protease fibronectin type-III domain-containing protein n=1 Tax=Stylosanthes scabra TaxID=79078 RepID=A0ABU6QLA9_9FABA|nr:hypothetical protein [Stylosanthes scabra]